MSKRDETHRDRKLRKRKYGMRISGRSLLTIVEIQRRRARHKKENK